MQSAAKHDSQSSKGFKMAITASYSLSAIVAASLLLSLAAAAARPRQTVPSQEPIFECTAVIGAEPFDELVKRVVTTAENQAFLTTQSVDPHLHPVSVLPSGQWETKEPGATTWCRTSLLQQ